MNINKIANIDDMNELSEELNYLRTIGYSGEHDVIYYDFIYKWARVLKISKLLDLSTNKTILDVAGGLSPPQFFFANNNCTVYNLDLYCTGWFPTHSDDIYNKYYIRASVDFMEESNKNIQNINYIKGDIRETIKTIPSNSIDFVVDICSLHIFINDDLINEIARVLKPNGYFLSIGDIANPYLGKCDEEFLYPKDLKEKLSINPNLQLVEPFDYDTWNEELKNDSNLIIRKNVDYNDLSLLNMKSDPMHIPYNNIPIYPIHIWTATYLLRKNNV